MPNHISTTAPTCNRRQILAALAAAGTAGLVPAAARALGPAAPRPDWKMKLSTSTIQFSSLPIERACERIAALGFTGVDIWSPYQGCRHLDECLNRLGSDGLGQLLEDTRLELTAFSTYVGGFAKYATLLGAVGGGIAIQGSAGPCEPKDLNARMRRFMEDTKPLVELAEKNDAYLAIENHGNALLDSIDSIKAFVDLNTSQRMGIALAPYHLQRIEASVPEAILACGQQLHFFYAWQFAPKLEQLPGIGPVDCVPWLEALVKVNYRGSVNPFMHGHPAPDPMADALVKSRKYLEQCERKALG